MRKTKHSMNGALMPGIKIDRLSRSEKRVTQKSRVGLPPGSSYQRFGGVKESGSRVKKRKEEKATGVTCHCP